MSIQPADIDQDDDNIIDEEEDHADKAEQRVTTPNASTTHISSQDPIIINR